MTAPSDFAADNSYAHGDGTDDPDPNDAGEHPALEHITVRPNVEAADRFTAALGGEMATLEHPRIVAALLAWREVDRVETPGSPAWWPAVYALRDIADRIAGQGVSRG